MVHPTGSRNTTGRNTTPSTGLGENSTVGSSCAFECRRSVYGAMQNSGGAHGAMIRCFSLRMMVTSMLVLAADALVTTRMNGCSADLSSLMGIHRSHTRNPSNTRNHHSQLAFFNFGKKEEIPEPIKPVETIKSAPNEIDEPDLVEKIFAVFFGKPEESPLGLKRFGRERFPEQYPAVVDEWADPVASDTPDMAAVRTLLKNTNLEERGLRVTFDANRNGWNALKFHQAVDKQGGALVVCKTKSGLVAGGYNPKGWVGYGENRGSIAAFLFQRTSRDNTTPPTYIKLRKVGGAGMAQMDVPEAGPCFGADSLVIPLSKDNPRLARSKLGSYYERFADGTNSVFGKDMASVQLTDLKVYHGVYAEDEYVPFTDAEPFALY